MLAEGDRAGTGSLTEADVLSAEINYLAQVIRARLALHFGQETELGLPEKILPPIYANQQCAYLEFLRQHELSYEEHLIILLALAPHIQADLFDRLIFEMMPQGGEFPQIGGVRGRQFRGFMPTAETALFIIAGDDIERRFEVQRLFSEDHLFARKQILSLENVPYGEPSMSGRLLMNVEYVDLFTLGEVCRPGFSMNFPAERVTTEMDWQELVLPDRSLRQLLELEAWIEYNNTLLVDWGMGRKLKRGFRALFHGPPGTGKTLTASLLGKKTGRDVYRIDLSMVISKFIGETEKNLKNLFDKAENKDWILFFDEADALFSKRTGVRDAHDKYANQEVAYLLQRVENYDGLVILASNFKSNIDEAFMRRFQIAIHFPVPSAAERLRLWQQAFPSEVSIDAELMREFSRKYELTGAHIMNVVHYVCLEALSRDNYEIVKQDLETAIQREFAKEGKLV